MGAQDIHPDHDAAQLRSFISHLLADVRALEHMLATGIIESGVLTETDLLEYLQRLLQEGKGKKKKSK